MSLPTAAVPLRHPEKARQADSPIPHKPPWLRVKAPGSPEYHATRRLMRELRAQHRVRGGGLPEYRRMLEAEARDGDDPRPGVHARLHVLQCRDRPARPCSTRMSPSVSAQAVAGLGLAHVVVTSVDRDDLDDGGAGHFARTIRAIRGAAPATTIEVLTPDFLRKDGALETVVAARPDVFNHNLETVPRLYAEVRPGARYFHSLRLLDQVKRLDPALFTKSGIMVGLGEDKAEVLQVMDDLRAADVDFLTIGQYLQPTPKHHAVDRFVTPEEFRAYRSLAFGKGFLLVSASPLTRSSYHAGEDFARLRAARAARLAAAS